MLLDTTVTEVDAWVIGAVRTLVWTIKSLWSEITDGRATILLAAATFCVAYLTRNLSKATINVAKETNRLAQETAKMVQQEDEHHRERFMPMCILVPDRFLGKGTQREGVVSLGRVGKFLEGGIQHDTLECIIKGGVRNTGVGPAVGVLMKLRLTGLEGCEGVRDMSFIGSGEIEERNEAQPIAIEIRIPQTTDMPTGYALSNLVANKWEIYLEYTDVFGQRFVTRHTSDKKVRWATFERIKDREQG